MIVSNEPVSVIIPTYTNVDQLRQCVESMLLYRFIYPIEIIIVNNGQAPLEYLYKDIEHVKVITTGKNLGWEGGLKEGLKHTNSKYVMFSNDDIYVPRSSSNWLKNMVRILNTYEDVGAVGPSTNVVMGPQNIFQPPFVQGFQAQFLVGFCVLFRRKALDDIGGVDDTLPGGDDLDYSIRLRDKKWKMIVTKDVFVFHYGFQTGNKLHGDHTVANGWNSPQMNERTNTAIIKKHGFMKWWELIAPQPPEPDGIEEDTEGDTIRDFVKGKDICELGVGGKKTLPCVGVDRVAKGEMIPLISQASIADVVADVNEKLPFEDSAFDCVIGRHILEHCIDTLKVLTEWSRIIRKGGQLILAVPDERIEDGVPLNPEHCHAFTPESLSALGKAVGLVPKEVAEKYNSISFIIVFEKA
mgnify:CR=1 FL=1